MFAIRANITKQLPENQSYPLKAVGSEVFIMSDTHILAAHIKTTLLEIAKQASLLGTGLQNAAPGDKAGAPNNSVSYLLSTSENLMKVADECGKQQSTPN